MYYKEDKNKARLKRHSRSRKKIFGTKTSPRLNVYRSLNNIYVQAIDDESGVTIASASSKDKSFSRENGANGGNIAGAKVVGEMIGKRLKEKNIDTVVFDRGGYIYHGRIKALADGTRSVGLSF